MQIEIFEAAPIPVTAVHAAAIGHARARSLVKISAGALSLMVHAVLLLILFRQDSRLGEPELLLPLLLVDVMDERTRARKSRIAIDDMAVAASNDVLQTDLTPPTLTVSAARPATHAVRPQAAGDPVVQLPKLADPLEEVSGLDTTGSVELRLRPAPLGEDRPVARGAIIPEGQQASIVQRIAQGAEALDDAGQSRLSWYENGRAYTALLTRQPTTDSMEIERVVAEITTSDHGGATMQTQLTMQRLAFSQFTQVIDRWDPDVQLHADEIVGRFHSNSPINLGYDAKTAPQFSGKVTIAARNFRVTSGIPRRHRDVLFPGGLETNAARIELPSHTQPLATAPIGQDAHVLTFSKDAHVTLNPDGSYAWETRGSDVTELGHYATTQDAYMVAARGVTLHVKGIVKGRVLIYSPEGIVIEGNLTYAHDPRTTPYAGDFLGLVSDKYVEIAPRRVTGPGDLKIDAAIFARRRFIVTDMEHARTATLSIYGSLTAGTISATEPRYATRIEFDPRFERVRPPGFPVTNRYELAHWQRTWSERP